LRGKVQRESTERGDYLLVPKMIQFLNSLKENVENPMAIQTVGTVSVTMSNRTPVPFPQVTLPGGLAYLFVLEMTPPTLVLDFGYLVIVPFILIGSLVYEMELSAKWYPKGARYVFPLPVFETGGADLNVAIALIPVELYKGRANPSSVTCTLLYEDTLTQPIGFGV